MTGSRVFKLVLLLTFALPLCFFSFRSVVFDWYRQSSASMLPTIVPGTTGIPVSKCAYQIRVPFTSIYILQTGTPLRGDIVLLRNPDGKPQPFIKRLIGLPGDVIEMQNEVLILNGVRCPLALSAATPRPGGEEAFTGKTSLLGVPYEVLILPSRPALRNFGPITVPPQEVFVLGDNRDESRDSRFFGTRPLTDLIGRVVSIPPRA